MQAGPSSQAVLRFEGFELDAERRSLRCDDAPVTLGARAFDVLVALVQRRGRIVTKSELLDAVWSGRIVEEGNLAVQVSTLRKLLGARSIATVPGQGYQWTLPIHAAATPGRPPPPAGANAGASDADAPGSELIGREPELAWLQQALAAGATRVTLVGPAGIGKTALARAWLARHAASAAPLVELAALMREPEGAPVDPSSVAIAALGALGETAQGSEAPLARLERCVARRARQGSLPPALVLDNAEHLPAAVRLLVAAVQRAAPALAVIVTSQVPLQMAGERVLRVEPLATPPGDALEQVRASPAAALLLARAHEADRRFALDAGNAAALAELSRRLDGIPLALELAAARLPMLGAEGVLARLDERWQLLRRPSTSIEARHQSLRSALDWSWALLPPFERRLLLRLATFNGSFGADEAQQLAGDAEHDEWAVLDGLSVLIEKLLVARAAAGGNEPRFVLLSTVADYARGHAEAQAEAQALAERHARLYVALAESAAPGVQLGADSAVAGLSRLTPAADNLRAAMQWCLGHDLPLGMRLAAALYGWWRSLGYLGEGRAACAALLDRSPDAPADPTRLAVMVCLGALALEQDDAPAMRLAGEQVLAAAQALGDRRRQAHGHGLLAHAAYSVHDPAQALHEFAVVLEYFRETGQPTKIAESLNNMASCWLSGGRPEKAVPLLEEALPLVRAKDRWTEAAVQQNLGEVHLALGDADLAARHLHVALALQRHTAHVRQVVMALLPLAMLELLRGRLDAARECLLEAVQECRRHGYGHQDALGLAAAGAWAVHDGQVERGAQLLAHGAAGLRGTPIGAQPHAARMLDAAQALARARLGAERAAACEAAGSALDADEAFALALGLLRGAAN